MAGKTRTTQAHGPRAASRPFKAPSSSQPPRRTASTTQSSKPALAGGKKRTREGREDEPEKAVVTQSSLSLLNQPDEIDFPRGGGTGLTQREVREAQLEGEAEAMDDGNDEDRERQKETEVIKDKGKAKRRKLERALNGEVKAKNQIPKDAFRVEHLNYKRLIPGTKVLCQVVQVRPLEVTVSLPNQLLGHIPITNISSEFTARLEKAGEEDSDEEEEEESDEEDELAADKGLPGLPALFHTGQYLIAVVTSTAVSDPTKPKLAGREGDETVRSSRRVELSVEPEKVNEGIAKGDLKRGFVLPAAVHDVEEKGYTLSFGLPPLSAFLPFADAKKLAPKGLHVGQVVVCRLTKIHSNERTVSVAVEWADIASTTLDSVSSITSLLPLQIVPALVTAVMPQGLNVKFHGYYDGTIDRFHLPISAGEDIAQHYKEGQKVKGRILWDSISQTPKKFALSMREEVVRLDESRVKALQSEWVVGRKCQAKIVAVDEEWGLTCEIVGDEPVSAFVHISRITDDHLSTIPKAGPWQIGTVHPARVVSLSPLDSLVQLSLQPSILSQSFLRVQDVRVGEEVKGTVKVLRDNALFVSIGGSVDGVVWPLHYADIRLKHPEKKFKPGQAVKARVFSVDPEKNRVVLTLKKQLLQTPHPLVTTLSEAKPGLVTDATVTKVLDKSVLVDFFGGVRALVPAAEAAEAFTDVADLGRMFPLGKVVAVRILSVDRASGRIVASARQASAPAASTSSSSAIESIDVGTLTTGTISALHETNLVLSLAEGGIKALLAYPTLARHRGVSVETLKGDLAKGQKLEDLVVVSKNVDKGFVIVGLVPSKSAAATAAASSSAASTSQPQLTFDRLEVGALYPGRVTSSLSSGVVLVQLVGSRNASLRGRVALTELSDDYSLVSEKGEALFPVGTNVQAVVLAKDDEQRRLDLSLRASRVLSAQDKPLASPPADAPVTSVDDLKPGSKVRGFVKNVANAGVFVELGRDITARVLIKELFDEYVKEWKPRFKVGELVEGKILSVDKVSSQIEMSFRSSAVVKKDASAPTSVSLADANLSRGQVVRGTIKRVQNYGVFIRLDESGVEGLCHKSKIVDDEKRSWKEVVREGQKVKAVVLSVDLEKKKLSLGLKNVDLQAMLAQAQAGGSDEDDEMSEAEAPVASTSKLPATKAAPALAVKAGFSWGDDDEDAAMDEADKESDDEEEEEEAPKPSATAAGKKPANGLTALDDRTGDLDTQAPTSVADFERLLLGSPNSSYLWIQYIAFFVGLSQLDKAREIGQRALKTINFREEGEKLNVWVALLNLENSYGDETTLETLFKEAAQRNDAKTVHLRMIDIYERTGKYEAEEELFKKTVKNFSHSSKVWTLFAQFYLTHGRPAEARELLPRSLKSLEKRKHVKTITKFAQLEFKMGDAERGRTIFEGIVDSYPKRLDLWFVYVDMEIKQRNVVGVRALFDRILAQRLSSKKGKSVFKKWLSFEKDFGDEEGVEAVKERAVAFVQSRQGGGDEEGDEE
ncbi:U3 snoRNP-associated protein Rrp5 [Rhodotorula toruloides ATCC 204091]|uniref:BY PROTMAP: gi/342321045/gb/EGU12983.1/ U3 snoRNP-associated protein Rrp5 [Rhodotorula glutinis ATCC 204091] n=1 Tax=Rhodotorula toruloides TaxID=5286 RepID=A0A0K3CF35_RHOTO|nr:U3 snoRNP-associated protein Rrp5 [Rhodotorula toruloides ATCC 204091]